MTPNFLVLATYSLTPFLIAFAWYHPRVLGGHTWAKIDGLSTDEAAKSVKPLKLLLSILLNFLLAFGHYNLTVHESGVFGMLGGDATQL